MLFFYKAIDQSGNSKIGYIYAKSLEEAIEELAKQSIYPIEIIEEKEGLFSRVSKNDVILFLKNLGLLLELKIDAKKALEILENSISNKKLLIAIKEIKYELTSGKKLSEAFKKHENILGKDLPILIEIGEETNKLGSIIQRYAQFLEESQNLISKIKSALAYPLFTLITAFFILYILMSYVVPQIAKVFKASKAELPFLTKGLIAISNFISLNISFILFIFLSIFFFLYFIKRKYRKKFDYALLKLPIFGKLIYLRELYNFFSYLSLMLNCKVNFKRAIEKALDLCTNTYIKEKLKRVSKKVLKGVPFSQALKEENFDELICSLVLVGEETAKLDKTLESLSNYFSTKINERITFLLKFLEPAITLFLGIIIGLIVIAIMLPLLEMSNLV